MTICGWHATITLVDKKGAGGIQFLWSIFLIFILVINTVTIYTVYRVNNSQYRRIILHNFAANITFGTSKLLQELLVHSDGCTSSLTRALYFLEIWGSTSSITGVMSLSLLQYWRVRNLNINNKITKNAIRKNGKFNVTTLLIVFTISSINAMSPIFTRKRWVEYLPICTRLVIISLGTLLTSRIFAIIAKHRRRIRRDRIRNIPLIRSQRLLKGSGVLLLLGWFPSLVCQLVVLQQQGHTEMTNKLLKWLISIPLIFPILHPLLYFTKSRDMKRFVMNRFFKCYSNEHEQAEELYNKLRVRRKFRRPTQIQPFVIGNSTFRQPIALKNRPYK